MKQYIYILLLCFTSTTFSCVDPVEPQFDFKDGLIFIDAFALSEKGTSFVNIQKSEIDNDRFLLRSISDAIVFFENIETGNRIELSETTSGNYIPPADFLVAEDESWLLSIQLSDGTKIESSVETVRGAIPIDQINASYSPEVEFDQQLDRFIPGHKIFIDWTDPTEEENYYLWLSKSFETLHVCHTCERSRWRDGICDSSLPAPPYYSYLCDTTCWQVRPSTAIQIQDDRVTNGATTTNKEITILPFYRREDILVQIQQVALTKSAFNYFKLIADISNESGGLNAPPPAGLLGNLFDPNDPEASILGQFTAASVATKSLYIDRSGIVESPLNPDPSIRLEGCDYCPNYCPCEESPFRTSTKPEGWL